LRYRFGSLSYWVCPSIWPSFTEIGEMACITPAWSSGGHALNNELVWRREHYNLEKAQRQSNNAFLLKFQKATSLPSA